MPQPKFNRLITKSLDHNLLDVIHILIRPDKVTLKEGKDKAPSLS